jgi:4'-phosphopantetheinyl transferase
MTSREAAWNPAPERLSLGDDDVHVWRASLNQPARVISDFIQTIAPDERERAARYHFQKDREHFIVARAVLRLLLGRYLGREPATLRFRMNPYGKPALDEGADSAALRFNLSHARDLALFVIVRNREVGIDLEYINQDFDVTQLAREFFSPGEIAALDTLPANMRREGFFRCWTRKEAYIKARGEGLSLPLAQFEVSLSPAEPAALLNVLANPAEISRWSLRELTPAHGYLAALAVEGDNWQLNCFEWTMS